MHKYDEVLLTQKSRLIFLHSAGSLSLFTPNEENMSLKPSIKIFISCHKECFVPKHNLLFPIQVGTAIASKRLAGILHDDDGENISSKNKMYCELTAQYWAWKNIQDADYVGFWHYRRYMSFAEKVFPHNPFEDVEIDYLDDSSLQLLNLKEDVMRKKN